MTELFVCMLQISSLNLSARNPQEGFVDASPCCKSTCGFLQRALVAEADGLAGCWNLADPLRSHAGRRHRGGQRKRCRQDSDNRLLADSYLKETCPNFPVVATLPSAYAWILARQKARSVYIQESVFFCICMSPGRLEALRTSLLGEDDEVGGKGSCLSKAKMKG